MQLFYIVPSCKYHIDVVTFEMGLLPVYVCNNVCNNVVGVGAAASWLH